MATRAAKLALRGKALSDTGTEIGIVNNADATAITIHASENVGIGNTASGFNGQADNLSVGTGSGANGITIYSGNDSSGNIFFADGTSGDDPTRGGINYNHANNSISFRVNDAPKMVIDSAGNVGIGTSSPSAKLHVNVTGDGGVKVSASAQANLDLNITGTTDGCAIRFGDGGGDNRGGIRYQHSEDSMRFYTNGGSTERMRISSSGNVGIGTSSPSSWAKLTIAGTGGAQTGATQALNVTSPSATANEGVGIRLSAASGSNEAVGIIGMVNNSSGNYGSMTFHTYSGGAYMTERMRINSAGIVTMPYQPYFSAYWNQSNTGVVTSIVAMSNNGGFTITSGKIYVPAAGTYYINAHGIATDFFDTRVCVNTTSSSPFLFDFRQGNYNGGTHHGCGNGRVISLAAGSYVTIYRLSGTMYTSSGANNPHNLISIMKIG